MAQFSEAGLLYILFSTCDPVSPKKFLCDPRYIKEVHT